MPEPYPPCRECGGHLQRVPSMPGHVVCGSGHLFTEEQVLPQGSASGQSATVQVRRVTER